MAVAVLMALLPAQSSALVTSVEGRTYGATPRSTELIAAQAGFLGKTDPSAFANPQGHTVLRSSNVYAIYWDPTDSYHGNWQHLIDTFFHDVGAVSGATDNVFAVDTQYMDKGNQRGGYSVTFRGAYTDTNAYPTKGCTDPQPLKQAITCVTDSQVQLELRQFISQHSLQVGMNSIFYLLTPPGVAVCLDAGGPSGHCSDYKAASVESYENSFCSYHDDINPTNSVEGDGNTILYAVIPWSAGGAGDGALTEELPANDCQDGGFDPSTKPIEKPEAEPVDEEPNAAGKSPDGWYDTGLGDLIINQISIQQQDTTTDPLLNAWQDPSGNEVVDECRNFFAPVLGGTTAAEEGTEAGKLYNQEINGHHYYLNDAFNYAAKLLAYPGVPCIHDLNLVPEFTTPNPVNVNELVGFDGMESNITLDAAIDYSPTGTPQPTWATYTWSFGDGSAPISGYAPGAPSTNSPMVTPCVAPWEAPCAASTFHSYAHAGTYKVTLTATDVGGNTVSFTQPVTVDGPPEGGTPGDSQGGPSGGGDPSGSSGVGGSAGSGDSSGGGSPTQSVTPAPLVTDFVTSTSLKTALRNGLAVRYSVNEQVAGSLQVLLNASTAKRLGIHGSVATGLPKGSPRSIVIGSAVLVTTKAGKGTIRLKFSRTVAQRLAHTHSLKLTVRVLARNASRQGPRTTSTVSTVTLSK
jgi:uncharacterized membrane protein YgcG